METMPFVARLAAVWRYKPSTRIERENTKSAADRETLAIAEFSATIDALGDLQDAPTRTRHRVLTGMQNLVGAIDLAACEAPVDHYGRRVLAERPGWSLAAIVFRAGQKTAPHDHEGWGGAVTVRGIERERRFLDVNGELSCEAERDFRPGRGYLFDPSHIHQVSGADPIGVTVALHFLVSGNGRANQLHPEGLRQSR